MAKGKKKDPNRQIAVEDYEHSDARRTNNPPAGLAHLDRDETPTKILEYDPHLDPQLVWAGKSEHGKTGVLAPSIHVHEELSAQHIVGNIRQQRLQQALFDVEQLDPDKAVEFYHHELNWSNRMILGDSLMVLSSLVERERMAGSVQCVFMDPPYGVKYNSNFQPRIGDTSVTDKKDTDLTREPEMIQAYRDTWQLGLHSYLTYLRDRLVVARELLSPSGSIFVQIGDENIHLVRILLDEVFGYDNFVSQIAFTKTSGLSATRQLPGQMDYLLWYARDFEKAHIASIFEEKDPNDSNFTMIELPDGTRRSLTRQEKSGADPIPEGGRLFAYGDLTAMGPGSNYDVEFNGEVFRPGRGWWGVPEESMRALIELGRVEKRGKSIQFIRYFDDFPYKEVTNLWSGLGGAQGRRYVVQTNEEVIQRCLNLTTQPGDLVVDPTCGSGTTALVAERLGRRWITCDTSRVALAIARERLLTAVFPYYVLERPDQGVDGGFKYQTVERFRRARIARGEGPEQVALIHKPIEDRSKVRVSGPFTFEALSRYSVNPDMVTGKQEPAADSHVETLLAALEAQGIPRPGSTPSRISSVARLVGSGPIQAEGVMDVGGRSARFAVSLGPQFGAITMAQVGEALRAAIGFDLVVFAGFAVSTDAQAKLSTGQIGSTDVALLLANPDLLVGDLLKNTKASQTFRLYSAPDVKIDQDGSQFRVTVEGVDSFDAATGEVTSFGKSGISAWFLDDDYDGAVFRVSQAFFPVTTGWEKLSRALRGTVDAELVEELHSWTSLPFDAGSSGRVAVRVVSNDGNAAEVVLDLPKSKK